MNLTRVFNKTNFKKPAFLISLSLFLLLGLVPLTASASFGSWLGQNLILPLAEFIGGLTVSLIGILIGIVQYNDFINAPAVAKGWVIVRDIANMFVIVVMLVIAFATVFRIEEYQYKKLLSKLLIMSVLVNFSKMLTGFFIDFAQVIMLTFVNGFKEAAAGNFVNGFHLSEMFEFSKNKSSIDGQGVAENSFFVASVLALISITVAMVVVAIYLVVFLVRIAFLWLLTIISPLAYLLSAFPGAAKKYSSEWWEYFGKYLSTGPILAFFLWLALAMMQTSNNVLSSFSGQEGDYGLSEIPAAAVTGIGQSDILLSFIVNIVILLGGLWMTQKLGVVGGKLAGSALAKMQSIGSSIVKSPFKAAAGLATWGERELYYRTGVGLNPRRMIEAIKTYGERRRHEKEIMGRKRASDRAKELFAGKLEDENGPAIKTKPVRGLLRLALGAQEDLLDTYGSITPGIPRLMRVLFHRQTGVQAEEEAEKARFKEQAATAFFSAKRDAGYLKEVGEEVVREEVMKGEKEKYIEEARRKREAGDVNYTGETNITKDKDGNEIVKTKPLDKIMEEELGKEIVQSDSSKALEYKNRFLREWDEKNADRDISKDKFFDKLVEEKIKEKLSSTDLVEKGKSVLRKRAGEAEERLKYLENGGLNSVATKERDKRVAALLTQLVQVNKQIADAANSGKDWSSLEKLRRAINADMQSLSKKDNRGRYLPLNDEEREKNEKFNEKEIHELEMKINNWRGSVAKEEEILAKQKEAKEYHKKAGHYEITPTGYYADRDFRHLEHEEYGKLSQEPMEYSELHELIQRAIKDKDQLKISALMKKAANDYNDNEVWNAFGYEGGYKGIDKFREQILERQAKMGRQASMSLVNEINYINEDKGHNNASRMYGVKAGTFYLRNPYEHAAAVVTENMKRGLRQFFQTTNRLGYGYETPSGKYKIDLSGMLTIAAGQDDLAYRIGRMEMNQSALLKFTEDIDSLRKMDRMGMFAGTRIREGKYAGMGLVQAIEAYARDVGKRGSATNYSGYVREAMHIHHGM